MPPIWEKSDKTVYRYDLKGNILEKKHYIWLPTNSTLNQTTTYVYDERGNLKEKMIIDHHIKRWHKYQKVVLKYDTLGNFLSELTYNKKNKIRRNQGHYSWKYNSVGLLSEQTLMWGKNSTPLVKWIWQYE